MRDKFEDLDKDNIIMLETDILNITIFTEDV